MPVIRTAGLMLVLVLVEMPIEDIQYRVEVMDRNLKLGCPVSMLYTF